MACDWRARSDVLPDHDVYAIEIMFVRLGQRGEKLYPKAGRRLIEECRRSNHAPDIGIPSGEYRQLRVGGTAIKLELDVELFVSEIAFIEGMEDRQIGQLHGIEQKDDGIARARRARSRLARRKQGRSGQAGALQQECSSIHRLLPCA
jgi:hypothetical protein